LRDDFYISIAIVADISVQAQGLGFLYYKIAKANSLNISDYDCIEFFF
jgi:nucleoid-associated protein YgaU